LQPTDQPPRHPSQRSYFLLDLAAPVVTLTLMAVFVGCYETGLQVRDLGGSCHYATVR